MALTDWYCEEVFVGTAPGRADFRRRPSSRLSSSSAVCPAACGRHSQAPRPITVGRDGSGSGTARVDDSRRTARCTHHGCRSGHRFLHPRERCCSRRNAAYALARAAWGRSELASARRGVRKRAMSLRSRARRGTRRCTRRLAVLARVSARVMLLNDDQNRIGRMVCAEEHLSKSSNR
jgi:hypothetical protein